MTVTDATALSLSGIAMELPYRHVDDQFIAGEWAPSGGDGSIEVVDPATEVVWGSVPDGSTADVDAAVAAARAALPGWRSLAPAERAERMRRFADVLMARAVPLSHTNTAENGSPVAETGGAAANAAGILRHFASLAPHLEREDVRPFPEGSTGPLRSETLVRQDPIGVCALIAPWNFPINLVVIKLAPALLAGCAVVIKPAPTTPLSIRFVVEAAAAAGIPAGVVNLVTGSNEMAEHLVTHPGVDKVAFTGSTPVGRRIATLCGGLLRPVTLELGGKSSAIVLPDADLAEFGSVLLRTCLRNTGQTCYISTRVLAPAERYDEVVDLVTATVAAGRQGDPMDPATVFGPSATRSQYEKVLGLLRTAHAEGARATVGGGAASGFDRGFFVAPTVLADVTPAMTIAREEIFGPVLTVLAYRSVDEAVEIANDTPYGLGGTVFSSDPDLALSVASRVDTGSIGLGFFASNHNAPFGGRHDSGLGVEYGLEGLRAYLTPQSVHRRSR